MRTFLVSATAATRSIDKVQEAVDAAAAWLTPGERARVVIDFTTLTLWQSSVGATAVTLPLGHSGLLEIDGAGSQIQFTAAAQSLLLAANADPTRGVAVGDLWVHDILIDGAQRVGSAAALLGTIASGQQRNISFGDVRLERCEAINLPPGRVEGRLHRPFVWLALAVAELDDTVRLNSFYAADCHALGGANGFYIGGFESNTGGDDRFFPPNLTAGEIRIERCSHDRLEAPTATLGSANLQVGGRVRIEKLTVDGFIGRNSADVGIEVNAVTDAVVSRATIDGAFNIGYTHNNYNEPLDADAQLLRWVDCTAIRTPTLTKVMRGFGCGVGGLAPAEGEPITGRPHGPLEYVRCVAVSPSRDGLPPISGDAAFAISGAPPRVTLRDCVIVERFTSRATTNLTLAGCRFAPIADADVQIEIDGLQIVLDAVRAGTGNVQWRGLQLFNPDTVGHPDERLWLDIQGVTFDVAFENSGPGRVRLFEASAAPVSGTIATTSVIAMSDPQATALSILGPIDGRVWMNDWDLAAMGPSSVVLGGTAGSAQVVARGLVPPGGGAYTSPVPIVLARDQTIVTHAEVYPAGYAMTGGTAFTAVDLSRDGGTTWTTIGAGAGAYPAMPGDSFRLTFDRASPSPSVVRIPQFD
ncbi:hypothetical protein [Conexibacter sp. CPCC 206217]|uniref:hypothetical protein n=1 Tax=Conexibacter sp. CPCC 206217 TaxID=3064574 RepID=UPI0027261DDF|nr:hypothetical protein [Conexibacter sp. CPCC 206217]MDO8211352.1 hypothetical protein [Conexibacter sp. CPCC 206217]